MIPTFFDLRTGKVDKGCDMSVFWWTEGNGACDCNRAIAFGKATVVEFASAGQRGTCYGTKRFIAIDVEGSLEDRTREQILVAMNSGYGT